MAVYRTNLKRMVKSQNIFKISVKMENLLDMNTKIKSAPLLNMFKQNFFYVKTHYKEMNINIKK